MKSKMLLMLTASVVVSIQQSVLAEEASTTNSLMVTPSQTAPMALMINGPAGRGTVPIEFWVDVISVEEGNMHFVQKVGIYRLPQNGYTASFPIAAEPWGMDVLLRKIKDFIWVPEIGLVNVHATVLLYLSIYKTRTENRSVARGFVEEKARSEQKSYKGVLRGEYHRVNLADVRRVFESMTLWAD